MKKNYARMSDLISGNAIDGSWATTMLGQAVINQISEGICYDILLDYCSHGGIIEFISSMYTIGKSGTVTFLHSFDAKGDWIVAEQQC